MVQGNANLIIDLGNSSTKCTVQFGRDTETGRFYERKFEVPNVFAPISRDYVVSSDYDDATSTILYVDTELNGREIKGCFCNGELQEREKPTSTIRPSARSKKFDLDSTVLSYRLAFLYACRAIMSMNKTTDFSQLDINWTVITLLPPGHIDIGREPIRKIVEDIDKVEAVFPEITLPIKIARTIVLPEGFCAYVACVHDKGGDFRPENKYLINEIVIVFDVGAGTTDCMIIQNNKVVQNSKYTIEQGGNNVYQIVRRQLRMRGLDLEESDVRNGIIKGIVKDGTKEVSIVDIVNDAKAEIAQKIVSEFQDFLEYTDIKVRSVGFILVCGGGSMRDSEAMSIVPLSQKLVEVFKQMSPNSDMVKLPKHLVRKEDENGDITRVEEQISPRDLNLLGASILAETL